MGRPRGADPMPERPRPRPDYAPYCAVFFVVLFAGLCLFLWYTRSPRKPEASPLSAADLIRRELLEAGLTTDEVNQLSVSTFTTPQRARVAAAEHPNLDALAVGNLLIYGPPDVMRKVRAALQDK